MRNNEYKRLTGVGVSADLPAHSFLFGAHAEAVNVTADIQTQTQTHVLTSNPSTGSNVASAEMKLPFPGQLSSLACPQNYFAINTSKLP